MEDDRVAILETQLTQAKLIAEEADKKYEEVSFLCIKRLQLMFVCFFLLVNTPRFLDRLEILRKDFDKNIKFFVSS